MYKKFILGIAILLVICTMSACGKTAETQPKDNTASLKENDVVDESYILPEGTTLEMRIKAPDTYERVSADDDSFEEGNLKRLEYLAEYGGKYNEIG